MRCSARCPNTGITPSAGCRRYVVKVEKRADVITQLVEQQADEWIHRSKNYGESSLHKLAWPKRLSYLVDKALATRSSRAPACSEGRCVQLDTVFCVASVFNLIQTVPFRTRLSFSCTNSVRWSELMMCRTHCLMVLFEAIKQTECVKELHILHACLSRLSVVYTREAHRVIPRHSWGDQARIRVESDSVVDHLVFIRHEQKGERLDAIVRLLLQLIHESATGRQAIGPD